MAATTPRDQLTARLRSGALSDAVVAAVAFGVSVALLAHGGLDGLRTGSAAEPSGSQDLDLTGVLLAAATALPLLAWRRAPLGVFVVTATASVLLAGLGYPFDVALGPAVVLYLLAATRKHRSSWTPRTTLAVVGLFVAYLGAVAVARAAFPAAEILHNGLVWVVAWLAGERIRSHRNSIAELRERARRAERDAERERDLAAAEERARIARDLHDSAGHAVSVIAVRAGAARLRHHEDPDRSLVALEAIEVLARQTAEDIDQIVGSLREGGRENSLVDSPPGIASLPTLITRQAEAGLEVTFAETGRPRSPGAAADQAVYRVLQEALTNATRHGAGSARIELAYGETAVEITVTNPVGTDAAPRAGGGHGLVGMRERAQLLGGSFDAGRSNGTFRLCASIPYTGRR